MKKISLVAVVVAFAVAFTISCGGGGGDNNSTDNGVELLKPTVGLSLFGLTNEGFPVNEAIDILRSTRQGHRATFTFPYRVFGQHDENFYRLVEGIYDLKPHIQIYAICGPCRRPRHSGEYVKFYPQYDIDQLNYYMVHDRSVKESLRNVYTDILNNYVLAYPELTFTIVPELESNMTGEAEAVSVNTAIEVFGHVPNVDINVNRLDNTLHGIINSEVHTTNISTANSCRSGDVINFDGSTMRYADEDYYPYDYDSHGNTSWWEIQTLIRNAIAHDNLVYIWRAEWQGLHQVDDQGRRLPMNERTYTFDGRHDEIKELLRL